MVNWHKHKKVTPPLVGAWFFLVVKNEGEHNIILLLYNKRLFQGRKLYWLIICLTQTAQTLRKFICTRNWKSLSELVRGKQYTEFHRIIDSTYLHVSTRNISHAKAQRGTEIYGHTEGHRIFRQKYWIGASKMRVKITIFQTPVFQLFISLLYRRT